MSHSQMLHTRRRKQKAKKQLAKIAKRLKAQDMKPGAQESLKKESP